jgi:hypothetical protein
MNANSPANNNPYFVCFMINAPFLTMGSNPFFVRFEKRSLEIKLADSQASQRTIPENQPCGITGYLTGYASQISTTKNSRSSAIPV